jgi:hypothetical protein
LILVLGLVCAGVGGFVFAIPRDGCVFAGVSLMAIGALNILFHRVTGRQYYKRAQALPPFFASPWLWLGQDGIQHMFLGIGLILAAGGFVLLLRSVWPLPP